MASAQQTEALQSCQLHAETAEAQVAQLSRQQQSLQSSGESCRKRALQAEKELQLGDHPFLPSFWVGEEFQVWDGRLKGWVEVAEVMFIFPCLPQLQPR